MDHNILSDINALKSISNFFNKLASKEQNLNTLLTPVGPHNLQYTKSLFSHSLSNVKSALLLHSTLTAHLKPDSDISSEKTLALKKTLNSFKDRSNARLQVDLLYQDLSFCEHVLACTIFSRIKSTLLKKANEKSLTNTVWKDYFNQLCQRLGLSFYEDGPSDSQATTTITICGEIFVLDIEINESSEISKTTVSYDMVESGDNKIGELLLSYLRTFELNLFEINVASLSQMDWLSKKFAPSNFFTKTLETTSLLEKITSIAEISSKDLLVDAINKNNGIVIENLKFHGPSLVFRMAPIAYESIQDIDFVNIFKSNNNTHWSLKYSNTMWFGWESAIIFKKKSQVDNKNEISTKTVDQTQNDTNTADEPDVTVDVNMELNGHRIYSLVARFQPYIWCAVQTVEAIQRYVESSKNFEANRAVSNIIYSDVGKVQNEIFLENLVCRDNLLSENYSSEQDINIKAIPNRTNPNIRGYALCRVPIGRIDDIGKLLPIIRRQIIFNELLSSGFTNRAQESDHNESDSKYNIKLETNKMYPFSILVYIKDLGLSGMDTKSINNKNYFGLEISEEVVENTVNLDTNDEGRLMLKVGINGEIKVNTLNGTSIEKDLKNKMVIDSRMDINEPDAMEIDSGENDYSKNDEELSLIANKSCDISIICCKWLSFQK
ncbi:hypothetical protein BB561_004038 [Smittium simulii]|uniref:Mediator of RNA polymerase II transcription subunit 1 n=1 Tax=Smittium simulii TaxID=133385 RepID=A0A2T9YIE5_9FUNG|nr:hypothetical protein BB561_004038 [Smittium simulii]